MGAVPLHIALEAHGVGLGGKIIVPDLSFVSTANAVGYCDATPIFADVNTDTWNLNPDRVVEISSPDTTTFLPVHLYGHPASMDKNHVIEVENCAAGIEDAAEVHGAE